MREVDHIGFVSDEMCEVVEELWPELARKLPPKAEPVPRAPLGQQRRAGTFIRVVTAARFIACRSYLRARSPKIDAPMLATFRQDPVTFLNDGHRVSADRP